MHQHEHEHHGTAPLRPRSLSGPSRLLPAALAVTGAVGLLGAGALLGLPPDVQETTAAPAATTTTSPPPSPTGTPTPSLEASTASAPSASSSPAPVSGGVSPPGPADPAPAVLPAASAPVHLIVPAAGIDQPVIALTPTAQNQAEQSIVPPLTTDAYWLSTYGTPGDGSQNTTYLTGHSWEGLDAPFDRLSTQLTPGDTVVLGTRTGELTYVVETVTTYDKNTLKDSEIWAIVPNRLVLISCFTDDPWGKNVVVSATPHHEPWPPSGPVPDQAAAEEQHHWSVGAEHR